MLINYANNMTPLPHCQGPPLWREHHAFRHEKPESPQSTIRPSPKALPYTESVLSRNGGLLSTPVWNFPQSIRGIEKERIMIFLFTDERGPIP